MKLVTWYDRWLMVIIPSILFMVLVTATNCGVPNPSGTPEARWQARNVDVQLRIVPLFQEVWYKDHVYVILSREGLRKGMLAHAGHCPNPHTLHEDAFEFGKYDQDYIMKDLP